MLNGGTPMLLPGQTTYDENAIYYCGDGVQLATCIFPIDKVVVNVISSIEVRFCIKDNILWLESPLPYGEVIKIILE